jgi:hypothetical protein
MRLPRPDHAVGDPGAEQLTPSNPVLLDARDLADTRIRIATNDEKFYSSENRDGPFTWADLYGRLR